MCELNRHFSVNQRASSEDSVLLLMILMRNMPSLPIDNIWAMMFVWR